MSIPANELMPQHVFGRWVQVPPTMLWHRTSKNVVWSASGFLMTAACGRIVSISSTEGLEGRRPDGEDVCKACTKIGPSDSEKEFGPI